MTNETMLPGCSIVEVSWTGLSEPPQDIDLPQDRRALREFLESHGLGLRAIHGIHYAGFATVREIDKERAMEVRGCGEQAWQQILEFKNAMLKKLSH